MSLLHRTFQPILEQSPSHGRTSQLMYNANNLNGENVHLKEVKEFLPLFSYVLQK